MLHGPLLDVLWSSEKVLAKLDNLSLALLSMTCKTTFHAYRPLLKEREEKYKAVSKTDLLEMANDTSKLVLAKCPWLQIIPRASRHSTFICKVINVKGRRTQNTYEISHHLDHWVQVSVVSKRWIDKYQSYSFSKFKLYQICAMQNGTGYAVKTIYCNAKLQILRMDADRFFAWLARFVA